MDKKQLSILIFALLVLFSGIFIITKAIQNKRGVNFGQSSMMNGKGKANFFDRKQGDKTAEVADVIGGVDSISEKALTIKQAEAVIAVNINGSTPVMIATGDKQETAGQVADIKTNDTVRVSYDKVSKDARLIVILRLPIPQKTN